ncbi:MAG: hypothetical protein QXK07_07685 [Desulfurococcaceae archaeon]
MRKKVLVAVVALATVILSLVPLAVLYIASRFRYQPPLNPLEEQMKVSAQSKVIMISPRDFVITRPLTWAESMIGMARDSPYYIIGELTIYVDTLLYNSFIIYAYELISVYRIRNCTMIKHLLNPYMFAYLDLNDPFDRHLHNLLLKNDCEVLYRLFSDEESWYASIGAIGYASAKYLEINNVTSKEQVEGRLFMLIHVEVGSEGEGVKRIRVKFYNVSREWEEEEMLRDARALLASHRKVVFMYSIPTQYWYDLFNEIVGSEAQLIIIDGIAPYNFDYLRKIKSYFLEIAIPVVGEDQAPEVEKILNSFWGAVYLADGRIVKLYGPNASRNS